jgi:hypothetical protein
LKRYRAHDFCIHRFQLTPDSKHSFWSDIPACNPVWAAALGGKLTSPRAKLAYCRLDAFAFHGQDIAPAASSVGDE